MVRQAAWMALLLLPGCLTAATDPTPPEPLVVDAGIERTACATPCEVAFAFVDVGAIEQASVWIFWDPATAHGPEAHLEPANGTPVPLEPGYRGARAIFQPVAGTYTLHVAPGVAIEYAVLTEAVARPGDPVLPNLANLVPSDIHRQTPRSETPGDRTDAGDGCTPYEMAYEGARRCLRFGNAIGNIGRGVLHLRMPASEAEGIVTGQSRFLQSITIQDGEAEEVPVGLATYHPAHGHWHYGGLQSFRLYAFDAGTHTRGPPINDGTKAGFCLQDSNHVQGHDGPRDAARYDSLYCTVLEHERQDWSFGVTPGWYDLYWSELPSQYVEISGVPDGVYELVTSIDGQGLRETTTWDNTASVVLRLEGRQITVLEEFGWYRVAP